MAESVSPQSKFKFLKDLHEKHYKQLMIITIALLLFSIIILVHTKATTGTFILKDVSISGGITISVPTDQLFDTTSLAKQIEAETGISANVKSLQTAGSSQIAGYMFEFASQDSDVCVEAVSKTTGITLTEGTYTLEQTSAALGASFFSGMIKAILLAFVFMSIVVFLFFRVPIPSAAVILCAIADTIETIAIMNLLNIRLSIAGIAALLLLVGYSVDTDILLSARVLKSREGSITDRIAAAMKTGLTMQLATIAALLAMYFVSPAPALKTFALIVIIGTVLDILNTWIQNAGILRWYVEKKHEQA